jgi:hydroxymethylglutaryl-CoA lyase
MSYLVAFKVEDSLPLAAGFFNAGVKIFDLAAGGLSGCPFVAGASGNVFAHDAVNLFQQIAADTGIDLEALCRVVDRYEDLLGRPFPGCINRVFKFQKECRA